MAASLLGNLFNQPTSSFGNGLFGNLSIFSSPPTRGQQRSRLLTDLMSQQRDPYRRYGSAVGGLIGMGARSLAEATGLVDKPPQVQREEAIRRVQAQIAEEGIDPLDPQFGPRVAQLFTEEGQIGLAATSLEKAARLQSQFAPEGPEFGDFETYYGPNGEMVEARPVSFADGRAAIVTAGGEDITELGYTSEKRAERTPLSVKDIPVRFPDGTTGTAFNVPGMIGLQRAIDGEYQPVPRGTTQLTSATATPESTLGATDEEWRTKVSTTQELVDTASRIQTILDEEDASVIGFLGGTNRFLASLGAQGRALINQATIFDEGTGREVALNFENYENLLPDNVASKSQAVRTNALRLAYLAAKSSDPAGRVSDADFRAALQRIGASTGDPRQFVRALQEEVRNSVSVTTRSSGDFLENRLTVDQFVDEYLANQGVNTNILSGLQFGTSQETVDSNDTITEEFIINNNEDIREIEGKTYYLYDGNWYDLEG